MKVIACLLLALLAPLAPAAPVATIPAPAFPAEAWLNGGPYEVEDLEGKAVILWYFYADHPLAKGLFPGLLESAAKVKDKPILFIAVNSGSTELQLEKYARETRLTWPLICDTSREFERRCGIVPVISQQNLIQCRLITPKGQLMPISFATEQVNNTITVSIEGTIKDALVGTAWKVEPALVPPAHRQVWWWVEWGQWGLAAPQVKRLLPSSDPKTKELAQKLDAVVVAAMDRRLTAAKAAEDQAHKWDAYKLYAYVGKEFKGYDQAKQADIAARKLSADPQVQKEGRAANLLAAALKQLASPNAKLQADAKAALGNLVRALPDTEAAAKAKELLGP